MGDAIAAARHATAALEGYLKEGKGAVGLQCYEDLLLRLQDLAQPARALYAIASLKEKERDADVAIETCRRLAARHPQDVFALNVLLLRASAAMAAGRAEVAREMFAAARVHRFATGEWAEQIERLASSGAGR